MAHTIVVLACPQECGIEERTFHVSLEVKQDFDDPTQLERLHVEWQKKIHVKEDPDLHKLLAYYFYRSAIQATRPMPARLRTSLTYHDTPWALLAAFLVDPSAWSELIPFWHRLRVQPDIARSRSAWCRLLRGLFKLCEERDASGILQPDIFQTISCYKTRLYPHSFIRTKLRHFSGQLHYWVPHFSPHCNVFRRRLNRVGLVVGQVPEICMHPRSGRVKHVRKSLQTIQSDAENHLLEEWSFKRSWECATCCAQRNEICCVLSAHSFLPWRTMVDGQPLDAPDTRGYKSDCVKWHAVELAPKVADDAMWPPIRHLKVLDERKHSTPISLRTADWDRLSVLEIAGSLSWTTLSTWATGLPNLSALVLWLEPILEHDQQQPPMITFNSLARFRLHLNHRFAWNKFLTCTHMPNLRDLELEQCFSDAVDWSRFPFLTTLYVSSLRASTANAIVRGMLPHLLHLQVTVKNKHVQALANVHALSLLTICHGTSEPLLPRKRLVSVVMTAAISASLACVRANAAHPLLNSFGAVLPEILMAAFEEHLYLPYFWCETRDVDPPRCYFLCTRRYFLKAIQAQTVVVTAPKKRKVNAAH